MTIRSKVFIAILAAGMGVSSLLADQKELSQEEKMAHNRRMNEEKLSAYHHLKDIVYKQVDGQALDMVLFLPPEEIARPYPVMLYTHGGGWDGGDKFKIFTPSFQRSLNSLLEQGVAVASIEYRLNKSDQSGAYECVVDCVDAARFLVKNAEKFKIDPERMGVWGESAGGHLSLMTGLADPRLFPGDEALAAFDPSFRAIASYYPATTFLEPDMMTGGILGKDWRMVLLLGGTLEEKAELATLLSPVTHLRKDSPSILLLHGDDDPVLPIDHSCHMLEAAKKRGAEVELLVVENAGHCFSGKAIHPSMDEINDRATEFILNKLGLKPIAEH